MNSDEIKRRIRKLCLNDFNLGFPHKDCRKIVQHLNSDEDFKADLNTFFHSLWSLSALASDKSESLTNRSTAELKKDRIWLEKSFFERWTKYLSARILVTHTFTPHLNQILKINEEIRELLLKLVINEIQNREIKIVS